MIGWLLAGCTAGTSGDHGDSATGQGDSAAPVDACPGAPVPVIYWYPRDGNDIFEVQVDRAGEFALGLSAADWEGEACGLAGPDLQTCQVLDGQTLALQTVDTTEEVVLGQTTWFKQERFSAWALFYPADPDDTAWGNPDSGTSNPYDLACVGSGYPYCCTRDSPP